MKDNKEIKNVVFGITGGIAAYKTIDIISSLTKNNINVTCVLTKNALNFVTELTLKTISKNNVITDMFINKEGNGIEHVAFADKADLVIIAPATANIIAKMAYGLCDDFLSTLVLATRADIIVVPSMNDKMYENKITQENINKLKVSGMSIIEPEIGYLACGYVGKGKFPKKNIILNEVQNKLKILIS